MAMRTLTAGGIVVAVFDSDFGIFDSDSSGQEDRGVSAIERRRLREETRHLTIEKMLVV